LINARAAKVAGPQSAMARDEPPQTALFELGMSMMQMMTKGDKSTVFKIIIADAQRSPELAQIFYDQGPGMTLKRLTAYLRTATERGLLNCPDPRRAAKLVLGAVVSHHHLHCLIGQPAPVSSLEMKQHVQAAVDMFLSHFSSVARS
jgi:hypothetical protein